MRECPGHRHPGREEGTGFDEQPSYISILSGLGCKKKEPAYVDYDTELTLNVEIDQFDLDSCRELRTEMFSFQGKFNLSMCASLMSVFQELQKSIGKNTKHILP